MGSIKRQEYSYDDEDDFYIRNDDDLLEAPTLSSEQMARARVYMNLCSISVATYIRQIAVGFMDSDLDPLLEEALYVLKTKSPEEAFKIFTEGSYYKVDGPPFGPEKKDKSPTTATPPAAPANVKEQPQTTVPPSGK
uniref:Uncharacterized protein n=1 Tax=Aegilops tauschii TaxID=37682 RepID=N1QTS2_AEGTA